MTTAKICSIGVNASKGYGVTLYCMLSERTNGCSWKRNGHAISIGGRYRFLKDSQEPRQNCSIEISDVKHLDDGNWTCEEKATSDTSGRSERQSRFLKCEAAWQDKQDTPITNIIQHYSSARTFESQSSTTERTTTSNNSQVTNTLPNAKLAINSFAGLLGALGLVVLIVCLIVSIQLIYDRFKSRCTTDNRSNCNESGMELNENVPRRIGDDFGGYAASDNLIVDSVDELYDDTVEKPTKNIKKKNGRVPTGSMEWLPGNQHHNLDPRSHSKQRKYLKLIFESLRPSSRANSNVTMSSKSLNTPKAPKNINNRPPPNVPDTRSSFANEEALNHQYDYIGVIPRNPPAITSSSTSTAQTFLSNSSNRSTPDTRMAAKHNVSFDVNPATRREMATLPSVLQHSVSTTQLPKYMVSTLPPPIHFPKPQLRQPAKYQLNCTLPTLPTLEEMAPKRISTIAVNEIPAFQRPPPPLPTFEPAETGEPIAYSNEDPSYEEMWLESSKITNNEAEDGPANFETLKKDGDNHETTVDFSLSENDYMNLVKNSSPNNDGINGGCNLFSPTSAREKIITKKMKPVKKKKPRPLERTSNKVTKKNC